MMRAAMLTDEKGGPEPSLAEWECAGDACAHRLFEAQAKLTPHATAVAFQDRQLTYDALNQRANQLAHHLRTIGVRPEVLVGLCVERSLAMVVGLLGILKAGGAYLPLDPAFPPDRLAFMLEDSKPHVILTQERLAKAMPASGAVKISLDSEAGLFEGQPTENPGNQTRPDHAAYVIYTSGSTGRPKGVQVLHRGLVNFLKSMQREPGLSADDTLLAVTTLSFDIAGLEIFLPLSVGARVVVVSRETACDGRELLEEMRASGATVLQATPATWWLLLQAGWEGVPPVKMLCGGEAMPTELAAELLKRGPSLWNLYGPTETTIWSTVHRVQSALSPIAIGRPIDNTQAYILDSDLRPAPSGAEGELHIGGDGVARGYLNRPELTAEKFILDPFSHRRGARLYKTGDLARALPDGTIEYLGRIDQQVKIRGFRIELGEIEAVLTQHPTVKQAVVVAREDTPAQKRLVAYLIGREQRVASVTELRAFLKAKLPDYMIPSAFVVLEALPMTANNKVDRRALPAPDAYRPDLERPVVAPREALERDLIKVWEKILNVHPIGIDDNFFELGGDSLLAVRLFLELEKVCGKRLPMATLFEAPTVGRLASLLRQNGWTPPWSSLVEIQSHGARPPFFCVHGVGGNVLCYYDLAACLGPDQPFYGLQAQGLDENQPPHTRVEEMAGHYLKDLLARQPAGPYFLGGLSFGGVVAFEMAQQLRARGLRVSLLALFDSRAPGHDDPPWSILSRVTMHMKELKAGGILKYAQKRARGLAWRIRRTVHKAYRTLGKATPQSLRDIPLVNRQAFEEYVPSVYPHEITLFRTKEQPTGMDSRLGWGEIAGAELVIRDVPGNHETFIKKPYVRSLGEALKAELDRTQGMMRPGQIV